MLVTKLEVAIQKNTLASLLFPRGNVFFVCLKILREPLINSPKSLVASEARRSDNLQSVIWRLLRRYAPRND